MIISRQGDKETTIEADVVVLTLGPWSDQVRKWLPASIESKYRANITAVKANSILMHPKEHVTAHALFLSYPRHRNLSIIVVD